MAESSQARLVWKARQHSGTKTDLFRRFVNQRHHLQLANYGDLHSYSVDERTASDFWVDLFIFLEIRASKINGDMFPPLTFFPGIELNFVENLLAQNDPLRIAIYACNEGGANLKNVTWSELKSQVRSAAGAMTSCGVRTGDRVAAVISNRTETTVLCLAALSLGALWSSSSPDMGEKAVLDRLLQIKPKLVFGEASVVYGGKNKDLRAKHTKIAARLNGEPEFHSYILLETADQTAKYHPSQAKMISYSQFLQRDRGRELTYALLPFSHPGFIVYSSGTTGPPKCIVHSAMGLLLQVKKDSVIGFDVGSDDVLLQYTTTGWIMWAMVLCGLAYGGQVVIYDGSPLYPDKLVLLRLVDQLKVTLLGTSAKFLSELKAADIRPREVLDLSSLRTVTSTGSTLTYDVCSWFYDVGFPKHIHLASTSGGTDLACSLVSGNPTLSVHSGEIQCESLGMAVDIADVASEDFISVKVKGEAGELVCTKPFPSQPTMFWGHKGTQLYRNSYFERFGPSIWNHGDFVQRSISTGGFIMLGRSDGVLNPSGVRFGSAEIYDVVEKFSEIEDSICVGQRRPTDTDETVILFVKTKGETILTADLVGRLRQSIRWAYSPRHVPKHILQVEEIPYTINGKKIEIAVKQIISGKKVTPSGTVANPDCFKLYDKFINIENIASQPGRISKI